MLAYSRRWTRQPQGIVRASDKFADRLSNLWLLNQGIASRVDLVGNVPLVDITGPTRYTTDAASPGVGLLGDGSSASSAKGLYSSASLIPASGVINSFAAFAVVTMRSLSPVGEAAIFRATNGAAGTGAALEFFPSTKIVRPLLATTGTTGWTAGNDQADSAIAVEVPWFFGMQYTGGSSPSLRVFSNPVGHPARQIKSAFVSGALTIAGPIYVGGMQATSASLAFPGVIHCLGLAYHADEQSRFSTADLDAVSQDPWQLFQPRRIWVPVEAAPTSASEGALSATIAPVTVSSAGSLSIQGVLAKSLGDFSLAATGTIVADNTATLSLTVAPFTLVSAGRVAVIGTLAQSIGSFTLAGEGVISANRTGELSQSIGAVTLSAFGAAPRVGSLAVTFGNFTLNATNVIPAARVKTLPTWYYNPGALPMNAEAWLVAELQRISQATYGAAPYLQLQVQYREPAKPRDGMCLLADGTSWNPGAGAGVYARIGGAWVKL